MRIAFARDYGSPSMDALVASLRDELAGRGHQVLPDMAPEAIPADVQVVFNVTDGRAPRPNYLRASAANFICTLAETAEPGPELQKEAYAVLVKTISNLLGYTVHRPGASATYLVTPELGFREVLHGDDHVRRIADQVLAISDVRFVIANDLVEELPPELTDGDAVTEAMVRVGRKLDGLGLLPMMLPLDSLLSERELRMIHKIFGVKQLSYGNLSARRDRDAFWMTGRGVNKADLRVIGKDLLLVTGFDPGRLAMRVAVPAGTDPGARVSVDAIEHFKIYREFPGVGAMIHVHAWLPGIESTLQNYPCGSMELADEVLELVRRAPDPANAVVGLKNHGVTVTGPDIETVFDRIAPRLQRTVPMV